LTSTYLQSDLPLPHRRRGKVRDVYDATTTDGRPVTLLVASDRLSAFDVVLPTGIPDKGRILTGLSAHWFGRIEAAFAGRLSHHLISTDPADLAGLDEVQQDELRGRVMLGRRCRVVPIECVARGYLAGSGWTQYQQDGRVCGVELPTGLQQCERLPEPIFTPATKAETGHDENVSFERAAELVGEALMQTLRDHTLALYRFAHDEAQKQGLILADTKFEFGLPVDDDSAAPILIDEALTPDSSRYWPGDRYDVGRDQDSFDKQYVRNHLQALCDRGEWNKQPPGPTLPDDVVRHTRAKYKEAYERLTGRAFDA
jgi:phosphoribosylaminoimidazole-succinocarboxamide synthase